jgi:RecA/RadA recombinase
MVNVALSGRVDGGLTPGLTVLAGPSKHFKSAFSLLLASAYMKQYPESVLLFYDSEFGTPQSYFESFGIDMERVIHTPITDIEELKFDIMKQLTEISRTDKVVMVIDSVGNLASKKEVEDAENQKSVADMSRAKSLKSLFRMVTPHLTLKDIPLIVVNHTYKEIGLYPKDIVGGGCVVAGTKIHTPTGLKNVEDFLVGDTVNTLKGTKLVTHVWNPDTLENGEPECFEIEFEDGYKVVCSDKHKFLINDNWIEAKDLIIGMDCIVSA